jgi:hypothetical protein
MLVGDKLEYGAANEAYCLISAYIREDGTIGAKYNKDELGEFVLFLAEILKHPENFIGVDRVKKERHADGSLKLQDVPDHDGSGLA